MQVWLSFGSYAADICTLMKTVMASCHQWASTIKLEELKRDYHHNLWSCGNDSSNHSNHYLAHLTSSTSNLGFSTQTGFACKSYIYWILYYNIFFNGKQKTCFIYLDYKLSLVHHLSSLDKQKQRELNACLAYWHLMQQFFVLKILG